MQNKDIKGQYLMHARTHKRLKRQQDSSNNPGPSTEPPASKRKRCQVCPRAKDSKTDKQCANCKRAICAAHTVFLCQMCVDWLLFYHALYISFFVTCYCFYVQCLECVCKKWYCYLMFTLQSCSFLHIAVGFIYILFNLFCILKLIMIFFTH